MEKVWAVSWATTPKPPVAQRAGGIFATMLNNLFLLSWVLHSEGQAAYKTCIAVYIARTV